MIDRIRKNFDEGVKKVKWFASFLAERTKAETSVARLLYECSKLETRIDVLYSDIGKRVMELKDKGETGVMKDFIVLQISEEIKNLKEQIKDYKDRAQALSMILDEKKGEEK